MPVTPEGDRDPTSANDNGSSFGMDHSSGVAGYFVWWREELAALAPKGMRQVFDSRTTGAILQEVDGQLILKRKAGAAGKVLPPNPRAAANELPRGDVIYLLPEDGALRRERRLPSASRAHVQDIMNLQMASETPFTVDEVYTNSIVNGEDDATREILVTQALAPRPAIDAILQRLRDTYGIELTGMDVADANGAPSGFNLLPFDGAAPARKSWLTLTNLSIAALVIAGLFAAVSWRDLQQRRIASADAIIAAAEENASEATSAMTRIDNGIAGIQRLEAVRQDKTTFLKVYNLIAQLLPTGTWLEEFNYEAPVAIVTGLSSNSAPLIEAVESSDLVKSARFTSPIVTDPRSGAERFRMEVTFKPQAGPAQPGQEPQP